MLGCSSWLLKFGATVFYNSDAVPRGAAPKGCLRQGRSQLVDSRTAGRCPVEGAAIDAHSF
eukprot:3478307-Alexandrium_andersonii.AAC.1